MEVMESPSDDPRIEDARNAVLHANLTVMEHKLLVAFIEKAQDPVLAASEVLKRLQSNADRVVEDVLRELKEDWYQLVVAVARADPSPDPDESLKELLCRRDQSRCIFLPPGRQQQQQQVPPEPTFIVPPSFARLLLQQGEEDSPSRTRTRTRTRTLMDAFMTPAGTAKLLSRLSDTSAQGMLANSMLVSPHARCAYQDGLLQIAPPGFHSQRPVQEGASSSARYTVSRLYPEPYDGDIVLADGSLLDEDRIYQSFTVQTEDVQQLPLPDPFLFETHLKFANALHTFDLEDSIAQGWPPEQPDSLLDRSARFLIRHLCPILPKFIRTAFWRRLFAHSTTEYVSNIAVKLPFGLYAKSCGRSRYNEPKALELLERYAPSIPAPRLLDFFDLPLPSPDPASRTRGDDKAADDYFVMTPVPGHWAQDVLHRLSYAERQRLADDLAASLDCMHKIPNTTAYRFASPLGGPIFDRRLGGGQRGCGPYKTEDELNVQLAGGTEEYLKKDIPTAFARTHESVFTHGDLFLSNVLVVRGTFSGLVDWEQAGFMPSYWDFTKAMRAARGRGEYAEAFYRLIWGHDFDDELETERWLWPRFPYGGPE